MICTVRANRKALTKMIRDVSSTIGGVLGFPSVLKPLVAQALFVVEGARPCHYGP
jgi:hypothetical protein